MTRTSKELGIPIPVVIPGRQGIVDFVSSCQSHPPPPPHRLVLLSVRLHLRRGQLLRLPRRGAPQFARDRRHREPDSPGSSSAPAGRRLPFSNPSTPSLELVAPRDSHEKSRLSCQVIQS